MRLREIYFWALDYLYVVKHMVLSVLVPRRPDEFRRTDAAQVMIIIPGIYENWRFMRPVAKLLYRLGYDVHVIEGLGYSRGSIEAMAAVVKDYLTAHDLRDVTIVAHSKGGLVGKYLMSLVDVPAVVRGLITINTPFSGSKYAYILPLRSLRIFVPNSKILRLLAQNIIPNNRIVSIYGMFDPHIPGGSKLEGAHNFQVSTSYGHFRILANPDVHKALHGAITYLRTHKD